VANSRRRIQLLTSLAALLTLLAAVMLAAAPAGSGKPLTGKTICIDPGHPSENGNGTKGPGGYTELAANWKVALTLKEYLRQAGATVVLTKSQENETVKNRRRAEIANKAKAHLMIRLHCDAASGSGFALYYPDRKGTVQGVTGPPQSVIAASKQAAEAIYPAMKAALKGALKARGMLGDSKTLIGGRQGALTGSIFSEVPIVTVEMVVLTNKSDEEFIRSDAGRKKMAAALRAGIVAYLRPRATEGGA
jgi:N-acetylmuramoyl-L-alanine amidase